MASSVKTPESEKDLGISGAVEPARDSEKYGAYDEDDGEVFKKGADGVDYRTNGWWVPAFALSSNHPTH